ncbi:hypothetical protein Lal_00008564 [Lupinus albus]|nr:hypothetical protein Lal_00008564 [Lupinus albus]
MIFVNLEKGYDKKGIEKKGAQNIYKRAINDKYGGSRAVTTSRVKIESLLVYIGVGCAYLAYPRTITTIHAFSG